MIIDGHGHACGDYLSTERILRLLDAVGVDKVVLTPGELNSDKTYTFPNMARVFPSWDVVPFFNLVTKFTVSFTRAAKHIEKGNEYVRSLVDECPDRIIQCYWVYLSNPGVLDLLEARFEAWSFGIIKLHQCWESFTIDSDGFGRVAAWATDKDLPIFFHVYSKNETLKLIRYIEKHPSTKFIIGHLYGLEHYMKAEANLANVYFEISTPALVSTVRVRKAIDHFGAKRIILGSDTPYGRDNLKLNLQRVRALGLSDEEERMILGRNMQRLLNLDG
jgi:predicted TIM-barrel fold metal-dependent hydrolase